MYNFRIEQKVKRFVVPDVYEWRWEAMKVSPIYDDSATFSTKREPNEMFCRYEFDGTIIFTGRDYDAFIGNGIDTEYRLVLSHRKDTTQSYTDIISSYFTLTDMDFDSDNRIAKLSVKGKDIYEEFLNKYDTKFDLVKLAPPKSDVELSKRAFIQIYIQGDTKMTHIFGNFEYEVDASGEAPDKKEEDLLAMGFTNLQNNKVVSVESDVYPDFNGAYSSYGYADGKLWRSDKKYYFEPGEVNTILHRSDGSNPISGSSVYYVSPDGITLIKQTMQERETIGDVDHEDRNIFARIIHDNPKKGARFGKDDIWQNNLNYRYYTALNEEQSTLLSNRVILSTELTDTPNKWMSDGKGKYFVRPNSSSPTNRVVAIGWNQWIPTSIWFENSIDIADILNPYNDTWLLHDAYYMEDAIKTLLKQIDPEMNFRSGFLHWFPNNPITLDQLKLYITPITNIKRTYYNQAAQRGEITLKQILDMMRICFNCYWLLRVASDGSVLLQVEHIKWFRNGGSYTNNVTGDDISGEKVNLSDKRWNTGQQEYHFDTDGMRSRVSYEWGEKSTEIFNGLPVVSESAIAKGGETEEYTVGNFMADVDYIEASPDKVSDDIYVLLGTNLSGKIWTDTIGYIENDGSISGNYYQYLPQNSHLTFLYLEQKVLNYDVDGTKQGDVLLDDYEEHIRLPIRCRSFRPIVREKLRMPYELEIPESQQKIKTGTYISGEKGGNVISISTNIFTQVSEIELEYEYKLQ